LKIPNGYVLRLWLAHRFIGYLAVVGRQTNPNNLDASLHPHYSGFLATTRQPARVPRVGTLLDCWNDGGSNGLTNMVSTNRGRWLDAGRGAAAVQHLPRRAAQFASLLQPRDG
jgi:hypothetical protein